MICNNKFLIAAGAAALSAGIYSANVTAATATANATANVIEPLTITKTVDLNFADISHDGGAGTVTVSSGSIISATGTAQLLGGTASAAEFDVSGDGTRAYDITFPAASTTISNGTDSITINNFVDSASGSSALLGGADTFTVGATLNFVGTESSGSYTGTFDVEVNYQ